MSGDHETLRRGRCTLGRASTVHPIVQQETHIMAPQILLPCSKVTKTGTTDCQGLGSTRDKAIEHAIGPTLATLQLFPPTLPSCPATCPLRNVQQVVPQGFTVTGEGEFDHTSPWGTTHYFYVVGTLAWSISRTCSKLKFGQFRDSGPRPSKDRRKGSRKTKPRKRTTF
jgi:hypothetical protein